MVTKDKTQGIREYKEMLEEVQEMLNTTPSLLNFLPDIRPAEEALWKMITYLISVCERKLNEEMVDSLLGDLSGN